VPRFPRPEWGSAFAGDPTGAQRKLVPVRVAQLRPWRPARPNRSHRSRRPGRAGARERLLDGVRERLKPSEAPAFPGIGRAVEAPFLPRRARADARVRRSAGRVVDGRGEDWVKVGDVLTAVDELDDAGETITLTGRLDDETLRRLDSLSQAGFGNPRVRFVSAEPSRRR
jgi:hypothetical protein